jgi:chemotaxis protein CheX
MDDLAYENMDLGEMMIQAGSLVDAIDASTKEVFETMLGTKLTDSKRAQSEDPAAAGVVSLVGLTGKWSGTGTFCCTPTTARLVAVRMLMLDETEAESQTIDDDVLDAVAELTNMVVGNIKNLLAEEYGEMAISIPTVVYGRNFRFKSFAGTCEETCVFDWEGQQFFIKVCLAATHHNERVVPDRALAPAGD